MERERLTITLRKDVLKLVDQSIDGAKLRNRSHAIEYFLSQQLTPKTVRVVLGVNSGVRKSYQAGGMPIGVRGSINTGGSSELKPIFNQLESQEFSEILLVGIDGTSLEAAAVDAEKYGLTAKTARLEGDDHQPGDILLNQIQSHLRDESFVYWDSRFKGSVDLSALLDHHKSSRATATAAMSHRISDTPSGSTGFYGHLHGTKVVSVGGDELAKEGGLPLSGVFVFESSLLENINGPSASLYRTLVPKLVSDKKLHGFVFVPSKVAVTQPAEAARTR